MTEEGSKRGADWVDEDEEDTGGTRDGMTTGMGGTGGRTSRSSSGGGGGGGGKSDGGGGRSSGGAGGCGGGISGTEGAGNFFAFSEFNGGFGEESAADSLISSLLFSLGVGGVLGPTSCRSVAFSVTPETDESLPDDSFAFLLAEGRF